MSAKSVSQEKRTTTNKWDSKTATAKKIEGRSPKTNIEYRNKSKRFQRISTASGDNRHVSKKYRLSLFKLKFIALLSSFHMRR
jgi:hypothetical protein